MQLSQLLDSLSLDSQRRKAIFVSTALFLCIASNLERTGVHADTKPVHGEREAKSHRGPL